MVYPAERLMVVVPADAALEIKAKVLNKNIGFVRSGQTSEIKVESFPFTKYDLIDGEVKSISADAVDDGLGVDVCDDGAGGGGACARRPGAHP